MDTIHLGDHNTDCEICQINCDCEECFPDINDDFPFYLEYDEGF